MQNSTLIYLVLLLVVLTKTQGILFDKVLTLTSNVNEDNRNKFIQDQLNVPLSKKFNNYRSQKSYIYGIENNQPQQPYLYLSEPSESITSSNTPLQSDTILFPSMYNKKKNGHTKKSLKKFHSSQSRNCFFSPINCMIQHDINKFRKMVDLSP
uniref:Uncharacterized protein n=1 Tax=Strongyloides papillosus TaxID=174720 RepID=A0A0N5C5S6_STREA